MGRKEKKRDRIVLARWGDLYRLLGESEIVLIVLDARNPLGTLSRRLASWARRKAEHWILVLNKADLVPPEVVFAWRGHLEEKIGAPTVATSATQRMGTLQLRRLLRRLSKDIEGPRVRMLVAGVPKTGKSSLINVLRGRHSAPTSLYPGSPGYTRTYTLYRLEGRLYVYDTPGTAPDVSDELERLIRIYPPEKLRAPEKIAARIIERVSTRFPHHVREVYKVDEPGNPYHVLEEIARRRGWVEKTTGEPLVEQAALVVIRDYLSGRLLYYEEPPR